MRLMALLQAYPRVFQLIASLTAYKYSSFEALFIFTRLGSHPVISRYVQNLVLASFVSQSLSMFNVLVSVLDVLSSVEGSDLSRKVRGNICKTSHLGLSKSLSDTEG